ncbi:flagellar basal body-associated protein FliL [Mariluticola halotolerans]|uniref:flagellar basal body-associated protein FliL n=1 Tax=Mariluticola halotolerans TaxID=2909283 RepID=UPI0026E1D6A8|nr:flagellar basal body-associated protein FliL [Mariluticola halotolerans]UJQ95415.1 flagellar basal body-associated FliL family protein [Mariluticola halotolerans]
MTDEVEAGEDAPQEAEPKSRKKLFIIIGAALVVLLLGGGAAAYFLVFSGDKNKDPALAEVKPTYFFDIPTMTVNLSTDGNEDPKFLKLTVSLELSDEEMLEIVEPRMTRVRDAFQVYLRELRRSDLEGSAGIYRLKEELRRRVNLAIYPAHVDSVLFKEILVQ